MEDEFLIAKCSCGFEKQIESLSFSEKSRRAKEIGTGIFNEPETTAYYPHKCNKCGSMKAIAYDLGIFYSDEANVLAYRCKKCGYIERQSDGTGN